MNIYPRPDYRRLDRYLPDRSPIAADLGDNRNLWGAHPAALEVLAGSGGLTVSDYPGSYAENLARAVADLIGADEAGICTGAGGTGVLDAIMRAVSPTTMRYVDPGWPAAGMIAQMNGHQPVPFPWRDARDDPAAFAGAEPAIVYAANPGNPTGQVFSDDWIRAVQERTEAVGSVFILDEAYGEYSRGARDRAPFEIAMQGERTICVKTLSKAYGLAGLRAGYGVGHPSLIFEVDKARGPFTVSGVTAAAAAAALASDLPWLRDTVDRTRANRRRVSRGLAERGFAAPPSRSNFVFILRPPEELDGMAGALMRRGVRVRPFRGPTDLSNGLRATVGPWELMRKLLDGLDAVCPGP